MAVLSAWQISLRIIDECQDLRPEYNDPILTTIQSEAQIAIDTLSSITRRSTTLLWNAPAGANLREILLEGLTIYALDSNNSIVYRLQLNTDGMGIIAQQPITFMSLGARLEGVNIGRIIGIAADDSRVVAVDETGKLIICRPLSINDCGVQQLQGWEIVRNPIRIVDIGCGTGFVIRWLSANGSLGDDVELMGVDFNVALLNEAQRLATIENLRCKFAVANAFRLAEPATIFISTGILHHFRDDILDECLVHG